MSQCNIHRSTLGECILGNIVQQYMIVHVYIVQLIIADNTMINNRRKKAFTCLYRD